MEEGGGCWMVRDRDRDRGRGREYDEESWEEKAFAEDAAGMLGGCVWPPRSYTCSFCRREFRSAQALGGHMNVHRRDRAKLKHQFSNSTNNKPLLVDQKVVDPHHRSRLSNHNNHHHHSDLSLVAKTNAFTQPQQMIINTTPPESERDSSFVFHYENNYSDPSLVSKTTAFAQPRKVIDTTTPDSERVSSFLFRYENNLSFFCLKRNDENSNILDLPLVDNKNQEKPDQFLFYPNGNKERSKDIDLPTKISKTSYEKTTSFIGLLPNNNSAEVEDDNKDESNRSKKRKLDTLSPSSPVKTKFKLDKKKDQVFEDQVPKVYAPKFEYLDLELRLGDRPKVQ